MKDNIAKIMFELMLLHPYKAISVRTICEAVPVSRPSFYSHFGGKEELLKWMVAQDYHTNAVPLFRHHLKEIGVQSFFTYIARRKFFYRNLYRHDDGHFLFDCLVEAYNSSVDIASSYSRPPSSAMPKINPEVYRRYSTTGIAAVVTYWVGKNMMIPVEEIARDLFLMLNNPLEVVRDNCLL